MREYPMDPETFEDLEQAEQDLYDGQNQQKFWFDEDEYQDFIDFLPSVDELQRMHARKI